MSEVCSPAAEASALSTAAARAVPSCAVLVASCNTYSDLWAPFFNLFRRYWSDCPFTVYLGTNQSSTPPAGVHMLLASARESWSANLRSFLEQMSTRYVLLLLDDFFLNSPVRTGDIVSHLQLLEDLDGCVLRLFPRPGPDSPVRGSSTIGMIDRAAPYRVSTQPAIWNRGFLLTLLNDCESAWDFEWNATDRSAMLAGEFYATYRPLLPYEHVVERGKWFWTAARRYGRAQIGCDFKARQVMPPYTQARKKLNCLRKNLVNSILPLRLRRRR